MSASGRSARVGSKTLVTTGIQATFGSNNLPSKKPKPAAAIAHDIVGDYLATGSDRSRAVSSRQVPTMTKRRPTRSNADREAAAAQRIAADAAKETQDRAAAEVARKKHEEEVAARKAEKDREKQEARGGDRAREAKVMAKQEAERKVEEDKKAQAGSKIRASQDAAAKNRGRRIAETQERAREPSPTTRAALGKLDIVGISSIPDTLRAIGEENLKEKAPIYHLQQGQISRPQSPKASAASSATASPQPSLQVTAREEEEDVIAEAEALLGAFDEDKVRLQDITIPDSADVTAQQVKAGSVDEFAELENVGGNGDTLDESPLPELSLQQLPELSLQQQVPTSDDELRNGVESLMRVRGDGESNVDTNNAIQGFLGISETAAIAPVDATKEVEPAAPNILAEEELGAIQGDAGDETNGAGAPIAPVGATNEVESAAPNTLAEEGPEAIQGGAGNETDETMSNVPVANADTKNSDPVAAQQPEIVTAVSDINAQLREAGAELLATPGNQESAETDAALLEAFAAADDDVADVPIKAEPEVASKVLQSPADAETAMADEVGSDDDDQEDEEVSFDEDEVKLPDSSDLRNPLSNPLQEGAKIIAERMRVGLQRQADAVRTTPVIAEPASQVVEASAADPVANASDAPNDPEYFSAQDFTPKALQTAGVPEQAAAEIAAAQTTEQRVQALETFAAQQLRDNPLIFVSEPDQAKSAYQGIKDVLRGSGLSLEEKIGIIQAYAEGCDDTALQFYADMLCATLSAGDPLTQAERDAGVQALQNEFSFLGVGGQRANDQACELMMEAVAATYGAVGDNLKPILAASFENSAQALAAQSRQLLVGQAQAAVAAPAAPEVAPPAPAVPAPPTVAPNTSSVHMPAVDNEDDSDAPAEAPGNSSEITIDNKGDFKQCLIVGGKGGGALALAIAVPGFGFILAIGFLIATKNIGADKKNGYELEETATGASAQPDALQQLLQDIDNGVQSVATVGVPAALGAGGPVQVPQQNPAQVPMLTRDPLTEPARVPGEQPAVAPSTEQVSAAANHHVHHGAVAAATDVVAGELTETLEDEEEKLKATQTALRGVGTGADITQADVDMPPVTPDSAVAAETPLSNPITATTVASGIVESEEQHRSILGTQLSETDREALSAVTLDNANHGAVVSSETEGVSNQRVSREACL